MKVVYGVVGEGMGHATRAVNVIQHLLGRGHQVLVAASGEGAPALLAARLGGAATVRPIEGLHLSWRAGRLSTRQSIRDNLALARARWRLNDEVLTEADDWGAEAVVSDFESLTAFYARSRDLPLLAVDNCQALVRLDHRAIGGTGGLPGVRGARAVTRARTPGADHYVVTSFFPAPTRRPRTTVVRPILRPEVLAATRAPGAHVVAYRSSLIDALLDALREVPEVPFKVYGAGRVGQEGHIELCAFDDARFIDDVRTARAVIGGAGFSLMTEALHLGVPMLAVPLAGQAEQHLNTRWLTHLGYGQGAASVDAPTIRAFLGRVDAYAAALEAYPRGDNQPAFDAVDHWLGRRRDDPA
jgi:uncharacterized protein (TIGR00661 family)